MASLSVTSRCGSQAGSSRPATNELLPCPLRWIQAARSTLARRSVASSRITPATAAILPASRSRSGGRTEPPLKPRRFIAALVVCGCPNSRASARSGYQSRCRWRRPAAFPTKPSRPFCGSDWWSAKTSLILALPSEANPTFFAVGSSRSGAVHDVRRGFHCVARIGADLRIGARHREQPPITTSRPD